MAVAPVLWLTQSKNVAAPTAVPPAEREILTAAPGRIEGVSETTNVGSATSGIVQEVLAKQGDRVAKGELLARIECNDIAAEISSALPSRPLRLPCSSV
jgi:multidrug efflux pump subunit AcrA (membrane-fusion protein)